VVNGRYPYEEGVNNIWIIKRNLKKNLEKVFGTFNKMFIHILGVKKIFGKKMGKFLLKIFGVNGC